MSHHAQFPDDSDQEVATLEPPTIETEPEAATGFAELGFSEELIRSVKDVGYEEPTPIQRMTIPVLLEGKDVIAQAQTGSGKTAAFGLPIIEGIDTSRRRVQALILCPTRELAIQVAEAMHKYGRHKQVETLPIYGGQPYDRQFRGLQRGPHIVVGTPGRVMDHMRRGTLDLKDVRYFVLDEADEMLDMGFFEDIEWILEQAPAERQTALFSATMPTRIVDLARRYLNEPRQLQIPGRQMTVPETHQSYFEVPRARKVDALTRVLDAESPPLTMIFCRTKAGVDELGEALLARGYQVETLHGDLSQVQRDRVMRRFRSGQADTLIATDVAARGLDVPEVTHVINFDVPDSHETYVHRIGRTGRAGRKGEAITFVSPRETRWLKQIERLTKAKIDARRLPTAADVAERRRDTLKQQIIAGMGESDATALYLSAVEDLADEYDLAQIAAAALKLYADETGRGLSAEIRDDDIAAISNGEVGRSERGMVRLFLNLGRNLAIRPQDIVGAIANEANIPGRAIGAIDIHDSYSFVEVPADAVERVVEALQRSGIKGKFVNVEVAAPGGSDPRGDRGPRSGGGYRDRAPQQRRTSGYRQDGQRSFRRNDSRGGSDRPYRPRGGDSGGSRES